VSPADDRSPPIAVVIAYHQYSSCKALKALLSTHPDFDVVADTPSRQDAVAVCQTFRPDVLLMDLHIPPVNAVRATRRFRKVCPEVGIVIMTVHEEIALAAHSAGADACVDIGAGPEEIMAAIREVAASRAARFHSREQHSMTGE